MRTFYRGLKVLSLVTLFFFCWSFLPLHAAVAYAATPQGQGAGGKGQGNTTPLTSPLGKGGERGASRSPA